MRLLLLRRRRRRLLLRLLRHRGSAHRGTQLRCCPLAKLLRRCLHLLHWHLLYRQLLVL